MIESIIATVNIFNYEIEKKKNLHRQQWKRKMRNGFRLVKSQDTRQIKQENTREKLKNEQSEKRRRLELAGKSNKN